MSTRIFFISYDSQGKWTIPEAVFKDVAFS